MISSIYTDFDGTVTKKDTVNAFFEQYADASWIESEKSWIEGRITSRENAIAQVALVRPLTARELDDYIDTIEIDDRFLEFCDYIDKRGVRLTILSDGFDLFIERTLERYGITGVRFYANHLIRRDDGFGIEFPHYTAVCKNGAGMCKCAKITDDEYCYIGDGVTDLCVAKNAKALFASKYLNEYCNEHKIPHVIFKDFGDILDYLEHP